jgi:hypothetical protein
VKNATGVKITMGQNVTPMSWPKFRGGKVTLKSNGDESLNDDSL